MAKDPVCGMDVDEKEDAIKMDYKGRTFYFDSEACKETFKNNPEQYAKIGDKPGVTA